MRAITIDRFGGPDVLVLSEVPEPPPPGPGEVVVAIHAAGVNPLDAAVRSGRLAPLLGRDFPLIVGNDGAGTVTAIGAGVSNVGIGERVHGLFDAAPTPSRHGFATPGTYAELAVTRASTLARVPDDVDMVMAGAIPVAGLTAYQTLVRKARIERRSSVLVIGASGGVGTFAVQIAKAMGAEVSAVDSPVKADMLRTLGVKEFIDYTKEDFTRRGKQYDVIFNMVASYPYGKAIGALRPGGRYLLGNPPLMSMIRSLFTPLFSDKNAYVAFAGEKEEELLTLKRMIEAGEITPVIDGVFLPEEAAEAHRRVEQEARLGGVVIQMKTPDAHPPKQTHNS